MSAAGGGGPGSENGGERSGRAPSIQGLERFTLIGRGGKAVVWRAWESTFNRMVAVKLLFEYDDEHALERFHRECLAVGSLAHPNIVSVHRTGLTEDTGSPFLQMEYLPKGSLADAIRRSGRMGWKPAVTIAVRLAGALATAHERGVLHRDIKPENVLLSPLGEPKLADFGIARVLGATLSKTAISEFTPEHATPEMARLLIGDATDEKSTASVQADVYCLASTIFTLLQGRAPFTVDEDSWVALLQRIPVQPVPDLRPLGVPAGLCEVIERGMAKDPRDRHPSAYEFGEELRAVEARMGVSQTALPFIPADELADRASPRPVFFEPPTVRVEKTPEAPSASPAPAPAAPRRRSGRATGAVVVALVAILGAAVAAVALLGPDDPPTAPPPPPRRH